MATILRYALFFFYVLAFSATAKNVTIEPGKTPGEALGNLRQVPNFVWKHVASGKIFQASAYNEQTVWGTMPAGEYELSEIIADEADTDSGIEDIPAAPIPVAPKATPIPNPSFAQAKSEKTVTGNEIRAIARAIETGQIIPKSRTEVIIPRNNGIIEAGINDGNSKTPITIPAQGPAEELPPAAQLAKMDQELSDMRALFLTLARTDPNDEEQENPRRIELRKQIAMLDIQRGKVYAQTMALRVRTEQEREEAEKREKDPYADVMTVFETEIKGKLLARIGEETRAVETKDELVNFFISPNCVAGGTIEVASKRFDCATIGRVDLRDKQQNNSVFITDEKIKEAKAERMASLTSVLIKFGGGLLLACMLVGGIYLSLHKRETARQRQVLNAKYTRLSTTTTMSNGTPPAARAQHQLAAPTGPSATQRFAIPSNATAAFAAPTPSAQGSGRYGNRPLGPTLVVQEDTVDQEDLDRTVLTAKAANTDSIYGWSLMESGLPFVFFNAGVQCKTTILPNGILIEVNPMAAGNVVTAINQLIATSRKPLRLHGVGISDGIDNYFILPDTRVRATRTTHRTATTAMA